MRDDWSDEKKERVRAFHEMLDSMEKDGHKVSFVDSDTPLVTELNQRIWACNEPNTVIQFRNCITDMYALGILTIGEYVNLNDNIDRYINYHLSHGVRDNF